MHLASILTSVTLLVAGLCDAKKSSPERFSEYHKKSLDASPLKLSETTYKSLTTTPRDYSVAVLLTALETRFNCQLCREFQPEWEILGKSWTKGDKAGKSRLLFGTLDFADGRDVFLQLGLQTAPVLLLFHPTTGPHMTASSEPVRYDFTGGPSNADVVQSWLSRQLPNRPHPSVRRPINWLRTGSYTIFTFGAFTVLASAWPYLLPMLQSRSIWASICMIAILLFTSGHMFNHIRHVPYVAGDGKGGIQYIVSGFSNQLGLETQIVAAMYGVMAFCVINLALKVPRNTNAKSQTITTVVWSVVLFVASSFFLSLFRIKNSSYPFSLPPFM